jgi:hypothetical protein
VQERHRRVNPPTATAWLDADALRRFAAFADRVDA